MSGHKWDWRVLGVVVEAGLRHCKWRWRIESDLTLELKYRV